MDEFLRNMQSKKREVKCSGMSCKAGASSSVDMMANVSRVELVTGYMAVFTLNGEVLYYCPACAKKLKKLSSEIIEIIGDKDIAVDWLNR